MDRHLRESGYEVTIIERGDWEARQAIFACADLVLIAVPIMLAAGFLSLLDLQEVQALSAFIPALAVGFITSAITGYFAIRWLVEYLKKQPLYGFAVYVTIVAIAAFLLI